MTFRCFLALKDGRHSKSLPNEKVFIPKKITLNGFSKVSLLIKASRGSGLSRMNHVTLPLPPIPLQECLNDFQTGWFCAVTMTERVSMLDANNELTSL